jgi:DNA-binding MarR family transcriptional regulator
MSKYLASSESPHTMTHADTPKKKAVRPSRARLLKALDEATRKMGAQAVLISDLVATRVGLNSTDLECLDLLYLAGSSTAGQLSAHTGLTTGATTAAIDRLERAGFVRRRRDPQDRRVVLVEFVESSVRLVEPMYQPLIEFMARVNRRYSDEELATVVDYLSRALEAGAAHVSWLQTQPAVSRHHCRQGVAGPVPSGVAAQRTRPGGRRGAGAAAAPHEAR